MLGGSSDSVGSARKLVAELSNNCPLVADLLSGLPASNSGPEVPGGTITFSIREGKIRFSANVKGAEKTFFGDIEDILKPWESIESAFMVGAVSSKRYTERTDRLTEEQKAALL